MLSARSSTAAVSGLQHHRCGLFDVALSNGSPALNTGGTGAKESLPFTEGPMFGKRWRVNRFAQLAGRGTYSKRAVFQAVTDIVLPKGEGHDDHCQ
jgi:hypothetical protein